MTHSKLTKQRRGFTLLEVLLVLGILVALAAILVTNLTGVQEKSKIDQAKLRVRMLDEAFHRYNIMLGNFPPSDQGVITLVTPPNPQPQWWKPNSFLSDPYLKDPWNFDYNYQYPGTRNHGDPDIWSNGPDGVSGSGDDIGNWPETTTGY